MPETVLIVDDERTIAQLTALWIGQAGYKPALAYNGRGGLEKVSECLPSLILLDIRMPDIDGFEVNRQLKSNPNFSQIPVIFLSAHAQEDARQQAATSGAVDFLPKPYEHKDLISAVRTALGKHEKNAFELMGQQADQVE